MEECSATLQKLTLLRGCFSRFLNCTNGTKSRNAPHIVASLGHGNTITLNYNHRPSRCQHRKNRIDSNNDCSHKAIHDSKYHLKCSRSYAGRYFGRVCLWF